MTKYLFILFALLPILASAELQTRQIRFSELCTVRVGVQSPPAGTAASADIFFLHGFADRLDNHGPLFDLWAQNGYRVVSFDLPLHGLTNCPLKQTIPEIIKIALDIEKLTRESAERPLFLAGWSTGGLIAVRMLQTTARLEREPSGAILITPAVSAPLVVGELNIVTQRTLTNNPSPPHRGPISPRSPLLAPGLAASIVKQSLESWEKLPPTVPVLLFVGGEEEDRYANTSKVLAWARDQRSMGTTIYARQCLHNPHELDNNLAPVGPEVRVTSAAFVRSVLARDIFNAPAAACPVVN